MASPREGGRPVRRKIPACFQNAGASYARKDEDKRNQKNKQPNMQKQGHCSSKVKHSDASMATMRSPHGVIGSPGGYSFSRRGMPSVELNGSLPRIPTLNLSLIGPSSSIAFSSIGEKNQEPRVIYPQTQTCERVTAHDNVVEHLNKIQDDLNRRLRSVRIEFQRSMSNSALTGSSKKRSSRLMSITSEDTRSMESASSSLRLFDQGFEILNEGSCSEGKSTMHLGRQRTHHIHQSSSNISLTPELGYNVIRGVLSDEREKLMNSGEPTQARYGDTPQRLVFVEADKPKEAVDPPSKVDSVPVTEKYTARVPINRKVLRYDSNEVSGLIKNVCAKEEVPDPPLEHATGKDTTRINQADQFIPFAAFHKARRPAVVANHPNRDLKSAGKYNSGVPFDLAAIYRDGVPKQRDRVQRNIGYNDELIDDMFTDRLRPMKKDPNVVDKHVSVLLPRSEPKASDSKPEASAAVSANKTKREPINEHDSCRVISVSPSDVEEVSRHYAAVEQATIKGKSNTNKDLVQREIDHAALTHLPSISGNQIKDLSSYSLEQLIQLSKVNSKCTLLQSRERNLQKDDANNWRTKDIGNPLSKAGVNPWFKDPLIEKMRRKKPEHVKYDCYLPVPDKTDSRNFSMERDLMFYIEQHATYRLDLEEHERHGVLDPFYEYERMKHNRTLNSSDWAKYGRPITKHRDADT